MKAAAEGGTRWGRALPVIGLGFALMVAMVTMTWQQVLAASWTMQNGTFQFSSSQVAGTDTAFGIAESPQQNGAKRSLRTSMKSATLNGFCLSKVENFAVLGNVTFRFESGDGSASTNEFAATNVVFDVDNFKSSGANGMVLGGNTQMGLSSLGVESTGTDNPLDVPSGTTTGWWAIQSPNAVINEVRGELRSAELPLATIPGMRITATKNGAQCNDAGEALPR